MQEMLAGFQSRSSISARIRQNVTLLGQELVGNGIYLQQGRGEQQRVRLELNLQIGGESAGVQQICDGTYLWQRNDFLEKSSLTRIDVRRIEEAMRSLGGRRGRPDQLPLALCGLPKLLEAIDKGFEFRLVQQDRLNDVPIYALRGTWRPEALATLYPDKKASSGAGQGSAVGKLPGHAPEVVVLLIGRDDKFPYRIEFRRRVQADEATPARTDQTTPLVIMDLFEVALDTPIDPAQFNYRPGDLEPVDGTKKLLVQMGLETEEP